MINKTMPPAAIAEALGERLKQARLNADLTQMRLAELAGVTRKVVLNAEKGRVQLDAFVALLQALDLTEQLDKFLPPQAVSPVQLAKLQAKQRKRASRASHSLQANPAPTSNW